MPYLLTALLLFAQADPAAPPDPAAVGGPAAPNAAPAGGANEAAPAANANAATAPQAEAAAEDAAADEGVGFWDRLGEIFSSGAFGLMKDGGWAMWPILLMAVVALGVIIERYRSLKMIASDTTIFRRQVLDLMEQERIEEAIDLCEREQGPVPAILSAGLRKYLVLRRLGHDPARVEEQVVKAMDDYGVHVVAAMERHLPVLATVSSAAPMVGFLGTVAGMIVAFTEIEAKIGTANIVELAAGGIKVALLTTCFGLIVGIPAFMGFNYFTGVINRFVLDVEESATELIENVTLHLALSEAPAPSGNGTPTAKEPATHGQTM